MVSLRFPVSYEEKWVSAKLPRLQQIFNISLAKCYNRTASSLGSSLAQKSILLSDSIRLFLCTGRVSVTGSLLVNMSSDQNGKHLKELEVHSGVLDLRHPADQN